jgi:hypothetical protein
MSANARVCIAGAAPAATRGDVSRLVPFLQRDVEQWPARFDDITA